MQPDPQVLDELVQRIVLFGSAAWGTMSPHSDLDVLVVIPDGGDCQEVTRTLYRRLRGLAYAKDIMVVQQSDVEQYGNNPALIIHTALSEGKELYGIAMLCQEDAPPYSTR